MWQDQKASMMLSPSGWEKKEGIANNGVIVIHKYNVKNVERFMVTSVNNCVEVPIVLRSSITMTPVNGNWEGLEHRATRANM